MESSVEMKPAVEMKAAVDATSCVQRWWVSIEGDNQDKFDKPFGVFLCYNHTNARVAEFQLGCLTSVMLWNVNITDETTRRPLVSYLHPACHGAADACNAKHQQQCAELFSVKHYTLFDGETAQHCAKRHCNDVPVKVQLTVR